jgi:glycosyltransferase involved in cell wall biosynthesis
MIANPYLSVTIPTYNRAKFLNNSLEHHIPLMRKHNVQVFISDNGSTDETELVVRKRMMEYPLIRYRRNETNLGADTNIQIALETPDSEYIWMIGDTQLIPFEGISYFLDLIIKKQKSYDALVFNSAERVVDVIQQDYVSQNKLLSDLGWHMTCLGTLIFNSKVISDANFKRYMSTNFCHIGIIFEYISGRDFTVHWNEKISIQTFSIKGVEKISWHDRTLEIWTERWSNLVFSLPPDYNLAIKMKCIKDHGVKTGLFSLRELIHLRRLNRINLILYKKYCNYMLLSMNHSKSFLIIVALLPISILNFLRAVKKSMKSD